MAVTLPAPPVTPDRVGLALLELTACLCAELTAAYVEPCWCGLYAGEEVAFDSCAECDGGRCGMGWVRVLSTFPYDAFPVQTIEARCTRPLAWAVEVGSLRCITIPDDGEPLSPDEMAEVALIQQADAGAMFRALKCCSESYQVAPAQYTPVGPQGGCVGGVWQAFIGVD